MKKIIASYDYYILFTFLILTVFGLYMQLNISSVRTTMFFFYRQSMWFVFSIISVWVGLKVVNMDKVRKLIFPSILITIILLIAVLVFGSSVKGAVRSIRIGPVNIQPSLLARIVLILYFAHILDKKQNIISQSKPKEFLKNFNALIVIPGIIFFLILIERHLSVLIISTATLLSLLFLAGIRKRTILLAISILLVGGILIMKLGPQYRGERMSIYAQYSLFHKLTGNDVKYEGNKDYQIKESLVSLGGGKLFGTSPGKGTGKHYFLPEAKTDYIFAIIGEEFGFIGSLFIMGLYVFLFSRCLISSRQKENLFLKLTGYGLGMNIFFNAMVNIGVAMSALPSTGVTLPFISYGGTSLLVNSFTVGLLLNISATRRTI